MKIPPTTGKATTRAPPASSASRERRQAARARPHASAAVSTCTSTTSTSHPWLGVSEGSPPRKSPAEDDGYNSQDEYQANRGKKPASSSSSGVGGEDEQALVKLLKDRYGRCIRKMSADGNCLFRSVADQIFGDETMHALVRQQCMDYMEKEGSYFSQFVTEGFASYIARKRRDGVFGNNLEIQAMSELYSRPVEIFSPRGKGTPMNICQPACDEGTTPIRLAYFPGRNHYDSVLDPEEPAVGMGIGLPGYNPVLDAKRDVNNAIQLSEQDFVDTLMVQDSCLFSDVEATNKAIEDEILWRSQQEYYDQWLGHNPH